MNHPASAAVDAYLRYLAEERRRAPLTLRHYRRDLDELLLALADRPLAAFDVLAVRRQIAVLHGQGRSGRSLARLLSAWRGFFAWQLARGALPGNPCLGVKPPRSARRLPGALSVDDARRLLAPPAEAPADARLATRDQAIFELFYSSGLRLAELARLDVDVLPTLLADGELRVLGKRNKPRSVPVGSLARAALAEWAGVRGELAATDEPALFVSRRGSRLSPRMIQESLRRRGLAAGLPARVHPHMLRHSCASHLLQSSGDLRAVQDMLGHASIASTQVYTHLDFQHLAQVYDQAHPRARRPKTADAAPPAAAGKTLKP
jgi:integrase/recombinase XerC